MPFTVVGCVVLADARSGPCSSGTASKPIWGPEVVELAVAVLVADDDVAVPVELAELAELVALELEELEPQPARARSRAQTVAARVMRVRARIEDQREVSWPPCWERCYGVRRWPRRRAPPVCR
jgi:hypothetical protein